MARQPVVAGRFYPGNSSTLQSDLETLIPDLPEKERREALAVILPHAGYFYSGATAGVTVGQVMVPETVIILGPSHTGRGATLAVGLDDWKMPMGMVPVNRELANSLVNNSQVFAADEAAHQNEHSLEVQVPFLQYLQDNLKIVPIVVGHVSYETCMNAAEELAKALKQFDQQVLLVASTDMSHYESRAKASEKDRLAIDRVLAMDPKGLYETVLGQHISMCGVMPTTVALLAAQQLGAAKVDLVRYTDSGEASGDINQVVGYAGLVIS